MASICNDDLGRFGVQGGHGRKTLSLSGQREHVLHLHHTPQGEADVNSELVPLRDASDEQAWFVEKMEPLRVAQGEAVAQG